MKEERRESETGREGEGEEEEEGEGEGDGCEGKADGVTERRSCCAW